MRHIELRDHMTILFQGDSITDCGRREPAYRPMGRGYASIVATWLGARCPEQRLTFENRGISGNRTADLVARWDQDCLAIDPDLVSILVGINNTLRRYDQNSPTTPEAFEKEYRTMLTRTREAGDPVIVVCEPFLLSHPPGIEVMREDLDPKIYVIRELAREFGALYIPYDGIFAAASTRAAPAYWAEDGVHPTPAGHALMAQAWMEWVLGRVP
ncbi:MAG: GDSL family lipase [Chitinivibrionales bacterium]|nr:GDSL family lipase [Chitinivibrionales bacterium]MBD3394411.1 GDSL family lipase [Chitinivibrionales bacterium]